METETFQTAQLSHLDFASDSMSVGSIPLPDELPQRADLSHLPKDILKSSTVENLISQNEDLMSRLKVALRRLSTLEEENHRFSDQAHKARLAQSSAADQLMVFKEKDSVWKRKVDSLEREKEIYAEKAKALQIKIETLETDLLRHVKYHDRIKNQVKPYISQLKEYSKIQEDKVEELNNLLSQKEAFISDLRHQIIEVTKNSRFQVESTEKKMLELTTHYEEQIQSLNYQVIELQRSQEDLEIKTVKLHSALEKQDSLENEIITLRRSKEELKDRLEKEISRQAERVSELSRQNQKLGVEHADLQVRVVEDAESMKRLQRENFENQEQLESLRFMWNAKNEENEKLKTAIGALEKLNLELSQKLNELRKNEK